MPPGKQVLRPWRRKVPRSGIPGGYEERVAVDDPLKNSSERTWGLCEGLIAALCEADKCKESVKADQAEEACMYFVKACSYSVHSLESLRSCVPTFVCILAHAEEKNAQHTKMVGRPAILQALQLMLFGYQFQVLPESTPAVLQQLNDAICYQTGHMHPHGLSREDISWVYHLGRFKTAAHLISQSLVENEDEAELCHNLLQQSLSSMQDQRPLHPTVLEAKIMYTQLLAFRLESQQPEDEESEMKFTSKLQPNGVLYFVQRCLTDMTCRHQDPAALMHLVLQIMYIMLKDCHAKSNADTQKSLIWAADLWHTMYHMLRQIACMTCQQSYHSL
ncbi:hypothetical protein ABBQ38_000565 [Trebouxia sp. C0009 RCD-2024]